MTNAPTNRQKSSSPDISPLPYGAAGRSPGHRSGKLFPYHQGSLDGLCGLYSIINAIQLASGNSAALDAEDWQELLFALAVTTDDTVGLTVAMACGLNAGSLFKILRNGLQHMADEHDILLKARRLLAPGDRPQVHELLKLLDVVISSKNTGVVLSLSGQLDHWTVPRRFTQTTLELFDSSGHTRVKLANLRMSYESALRTAVQHILYPRAIFCIEAR